MSSKSNTTTNNKRLAKNTIFLYARMLIVMFISFYSTRALLSALGILDYGVYNIVCGFVAMIGFLNTSMANGIQRFYNVEIGKNGDENVAKIFSHALTIQLWLSLLILILSETIGLWYLYNKLVIPDGRFDAAFCIFQLSIFSLIMVIIAVPYSAAVMAYEHMDFFAILSIFDSVLKLVIVLVLPYFKGDLLIIYGILYSLISVVNLGLNFIFCRTKIPSLKFNKGKDIALFKSLLSFSGWNMFGSVAHMGKIQGVNLVLNSFWGTVVNTAFGISSQITAAVSSLLSGFLTAVRPQMIKSYSSGDLDRTMIMLYSISKLTFFLVMVLAVPLIGEIKTVLNFWLGYGNYPDLTVSFAQLTILTILSDSFATPLSIIVHASGKMKRFQIVCSTIIISVVPLSYIVAKLDNPPYMVLFVGLIVTILTQMTRLFLIKHIVSFSIMNYVRKVIFPTSLVFFLSLVSTYSIHILDYESIEISILKMFFSFVLSVIYIYMIGLNQSEKKIVFSMFNINKKCI